MKSQLQVLKFLNQYYPASDLDRDMIEAFVEKRYNITPTTTVFGTSSKALDVLGFNRWYLEGYAVAEVAWYKEQDESRLVMVGDCSLDEVEVLGKLNGDGCVVVEKFKSSANNFSKASSDDVVLFLERLACSSLQINPYTPELIYKHVPRSGEKVSFYSWDFATEGIGVVRGVDGFEVELYCYFIYPSKTGKGRVGYNMHEKGIINLRDYVFEPLLEDDETDSFKRFSPDNGISTYRRLKRELEKRGKVWKDKLLRIEPVDMRLDEGQKYWFITDKFKLAQEFEKGTPTSQFRYSSGNYFPDHETAEKVLNALNEIVENVLAAPNDVQEAD